MKEATPSDNTYDIPHILILRINILKYRHQYCSKIFLKFILYPYFLFQFKEFLLFNSQCPLC